MSSDIDFVSSEEVEVTPVGVGVYSVNRFAGDCQTCGRRVQTEEGKYLGRDKATGKPMVSHLDGVCTDPSRCSVCREPLDWGAFEGKCSRCKHGTPAEAVDVDEVALAKMRAEIRRSSHPDVEQSEQRAG